jgi:hypothetical protein
VKLVLEITPYLDVDEAEEYFSTRLETIVWDDSELSDKTKSLKMATNIINRLNFQGSKTDPEQNNQFPRYPETEIPNDVKIACCEIALSLLSGVDPEREMEALRMESQTYGNVKATYKHGDVEHIMAGVPSSVAWRYLRPYLRDPHGVRLSRIS